MEARDNLVPVSMGEMLSTCPPLKPSPDPAMVPIAITWTGSSAEEGWPRLQEKIAKPPYWSGRGGAGPVQWTSHNGHLTFDMYNERHSTTRTDPSERSS